MKSRRLILIGSLVLIVALLASAGAACTSAEQKTQLEVEAVVWEYLEACFLQDRDRALDCLPSSSTLEDEEGNWITSIVIRGLVGDFDNLDLHFDPWEEVYTDDTPFVIDDDSPIILIGCQVVGEEYNLALEFFLVEEQGEWKIRGWQQDLSS